MNIKKWFSNSAEYRCPNCHKKTRVLYVIKLAHFPSIQICHRCLYKSKF